MRTTPLHKARARLSELVDRALAGEPQRITRRGKDAVVIVSEAAWNKRLSSALTLADLFLKYAGEEGYEDLLGERPWKEEHPLGSEFLET